MIHRHALRALAMLPPLPARYRGKMVPQRQPNTERLVYAQAILAVQEQAKKLLDAELLPRLPELVKQAGIVHDAAVRANSYADELARVLNGVAKKLFGEFTNARLRKTALGIAQRTSNTQKAELARQLSGAYAKDIGIDVFAEAGIPERLQAFAANNALLVKNLPQRFYDEVGQRVVQGLRTGRRAEALQAEIADRYGVSQSRARLIARDQVGRLYAELNQARQQDLGIKRFTWAASRDERECDECAPYDGKTYDWDNAPELPGEIHPNCRCTAEPDVQGEIDAL